VREVREHVQRMLVVVAAEDQDRHQSKRTEFTAEPMLRERDWNALARQRARRCAGYLNTPGVGRGG
jgi:hypothetical protein